VRCMRRMGKMRLDLETADRILAGQVDPADAPPGYQAVVTLILSVRTPDAPVRIPTIAASRPSAPLRSRRRTMLATVPFRPRLSILAAAVVLGGASGAAYAAGLPAAASSTAQAMLQSLGVTPGAKAHGGGSSSAGTHGAAVSTLARTTTATGSAKGAQIAATASAGRSHAGDHSGDSAGARGGDAGAKSHGHGSTISALAHSTSGTAGAKGATISAAASGGKSHAGQHGHNGQSKSSHGNSAGHSQSSGHSHSSGNGHSGS
jgi:hypothetical protein